MSDTFGDDYFEAYNRFHAPSKEERQRKSQVISDVLDATDIYAVRRAISSCDKYELSNIVEILWRKNIPKGDGETNV